MVTSPDELALPVILDITLAQELRGHLLERLGAGAVIMDASAVDRVSTPCIQVLLAAGRSAAESGTPFRIAGPSEAFAAALADLGVEAEFRKWVG